MIKRCSENICGIHTSLELYTSPFYNNQNQIDPNSKPYSASEVQSQKKPIRYYKISGFAKPDAYIITFPCSFTQKDQKDFNKEQIKI